MKVSLEWLSDFVDLPAGMGPAELAHQLTLKTVEVEDVLQIDGDVVFEIDNKSLTNRPDLWGHLGIAREFAAIYGLPLRSLPSMSRPAAVEGLVESINPALCTRFAAVEFSTDACATPDWMRNRLARIEEASVHSLVDLANYVMFTVGQPTHVYDADRVSLPLSAGLTTDASTFKLLSGQSVNLDAQSPVIRDTREIIGVAGVMGGAASAVQPGSRRFLLEAASFRPQVIRRASQRLGVRTEASVRYEKSLDTQRVDLAVDLFLHLLPQVAPAATVAGMQNVLVEATRTVELAVDRQFLLNRIGEDLGDETIHATLRALGFTTADRGGDFLITAPTWRSTGDVSLPHDIVEEVARIYGYDRLAVAQTSVTLSTVRSLNRRSLDRDVREQLALRAGLQEVITYPWTTDHLLAAAGYDKEQTVRFEGASAPDRDSLRSSLLSNLLEAIASNLRYRLMFGIFEVGTVFNATEWAPYKGMYEVMPAQSLLLGVALVGDDGAALFRRAKGVLSMMRRYCHILDLCLEGGTDAPWADLSARLGIRANNRQVGTLGLLTPRTRRLAGIEGVQVAYTEIDLRHLSVHRSRDNRFEALSELPETDFDLSVVVADNVTWAAVETVVGGVDKLISAVTYVDEYRGSWVPDGHRSLTLRVVLRPADATLTADEIGRVRTRTLEVLGQEFGARLR